MVGLCVNECVDGVCEEHIPVSRNEIVIIYQFFAGSDSHDRLLKRGVFVILWCYGLG